MTETNANNSLLCVEEGCEDTITIDQAKEGEGIVTEFSSFLPPYTEWYAWCEDHRPDEHELEELGPKIKAGTHGFEPSYMEEHPWPGGEE